MVHQTGPADFGVIGYGRFGRFMAAHLGAHGATVAADLRWAEIPPATDPGIAPVSFEEACRARHVVFAVPIGALRAALARARPHIQPGTVVADTASVKVWPCRWLLEELPGEVEILGTHPLFGPDSAASGLAGHKIALVPLRVGDMDRIRGFLESFGLTVIETTADAHDREMAETQSLVHWLGRGLERIGARPHELDTAGYRRLLEILGHVTGDSWELFLDLQRWNPYAAAARRRVLEVLGDLDRETTGREPGSQG